MLNVVAELVSEHVCLGEIARRAETLSQLVEKSEVEIHPFIDRTVEWSHHRLGRSTSRVRRVAKQDQAGRSEPSSIIRKDLRPRALHIVQNERDELNLGLLGGGIRR